MRISGSLLFLVSLTACGVSDEAATAAPAIVACPTQLTSKTPLPAGARVLGKIEGTLALWEAGVSFGTPADIADDRVLSSVEQDEESPLPAKRHLYRYEIQPGATDIPGEIERFLLACSYAASAKLAATNGPGSALLLIPLPYKANARCDVIHDNSDAATRRPLISATCERVK